MRRLRQRCEEEGGEEMEQDGGGRRRQVRKRKRESKEQKARCQPASQPASHLLDPIFFKRPAHSSRPDSLTIIKRKSFYSAVSFRLCSYFFATNFRLLFLPRSPSSSLADIVRPPPPPPPPKGLFYYPITLICLAKGSNACEGNECKTLAT